MGTRPQMTRRPPHIAQGDFVCTIGNAPSQCRHGDVVAVADPEILLRQAQQQGDGIVIGCAVWSGLHEDLPVGDSVGEEGAVHAEAEVHLVKRAL